MSHGSDEPRQQWAMDFTALRCSRCRWPPAPTRGGRAHGPRPGRRRPPAPWGSHRREFCYSAAAPLAVHTMTAREGSGNTRHRQCLGSHKGRGTHKAKGSAVHDSPCSEHRPSSSRVALTTSDCVYKNKQQKATGSVPSPIELRRVRVILRVLLSTAVFTVPYKQRECARATGKGVCAKALVVTSVRRSHRQTQQSSRDPGLPAAAAAAWFDHDPR